MTFCVRHVFVLFVCVVIMLVVLDANVCVYRLLLLFFVSVFIVVCCVVMC